VSICRTDSEFLLPRCAAREQQVRKVRADDQHHYAHRERQQNHRRAHRAADVFGERFQTRLEIVALALIFVLKPLGQRASFRLSARCADARVQSADHRERVAPLVGLVVQRKAGKQIDLRAWRENIAEVEGRRQHADDLVRAIVEAQRGADHIWIRAEVAFPEVIGNDDHFVFA
jgi:hypothetical protein